MTLGANQNTNQSANPASGGSRNSHALYLYGVSERCDPAAAADLVGVDATSPVECIPCQQFFCWVSRVSRTDYADRLAENMENLDWLAAAGVRHQRVVGRLAERLDVLPARFGSVFLNEQSLAADVRNRAADLRRALDRIRGAEEWGVKLFALPSAERPVISAATGRDYLERKQAQLADRGKPAPPRETAQLAAELDGIASASTPHPKPATQQAGLIWQASYLVPRTRVKKFHAVLQRFAPRLTGARLESTGPWPAYSFVSTPAMRRIAPQPDGDHRGRHHEQPNEHPNTNGKSAKSSGGAAPKKASHSSRRSAKKRQPAKKRRSTPKRRASQRAPARMRTNSRKQKTRKRSGTSKKSKRR